MLEEFLNKRVKIIRKTDGFLFIGIFKNTNSIGITLDDRKDGLMFIPFADIQEIVEVRENE